MIAACASTAPAPQTPPAPPPAPEPPHADHFHMRFEKADQWTKVFDDPARDDWQKPDQVIDALALAPNAKVADVGAGTGYFAVRIAKRVPNGVVYAVDVEPDMIRFLGAKSIANLRPILGTPDDAKIPEPVDLVLVVDTYHHVPNRKAYFAKIRASRLAIIDFTRASPMGPPPEHRIPPEEVDRELGAAGWHRTGSHDFLPNQYFLVYAR